MGDENWVMSDHFFKPNKALIFTLRGWNTCNKGVQDLSQGMKKNIFENKLKY